MKRIPLLTTAFALVLMTGTAALAQNAPDSSADATATASDTSPDNSAASSSGYQTHRSNMSNANTRSCASELSDGNHRIRQSSDMNGTADGNAMASNAPAQRGENCTNQIYPGPR